MTVRERFPAKADESIADEKNPAIRAFGRRFYRDQTPLEYLAEFLLCFDSPKVLDRGAGDELSLGVGLPSEWGALSGGEVGYATRGAIALKLFSFFRSSKLETRHPAHVERFRELLKQIGDAIEADPADRERAVQILQQLFAGFVGVAGQRTWVTHSFIPASRFLLSREIDWRHTEAVRDGVEKWEDAEEYFHGSSHNFMARGGELLFLQIWSALRVEDPRREDTGFAGTYPHLASNGLAEQLERGINDLLLAIDGPLKMLGSAIEAAAEGDPEIADSGGNQAFGWVPSETWYEGTLFAWELANIARSKKDPLRKLRVMQELCCLQVLRSLCFQASRLVQGGSGEGRQFPGGYCWIVSSPKTGQGRDIGKLSSTSVGSVEELLYKSVRIDHEDSDLADKADDHAFKLFRKLGKQIGLVVPRTGPSPRFTLTSSQVETAVVALIPPGQRLPFDAFLWRLYLHFGIAVGAPQIEAAIRDCGLSARFSPSRTCASWLEDELKRGGFLIPLSDATPLVANPA